ncbi:MAG: pyrroloquinoline quinone-dependent dehydrogenase [Terriglobia bacterium]|nr:MAG: pyrroloquinoline quinone-dependent dehydrogenase [Terriglobia bacterium]
MRSITAFVFGISTLLPALSAQSAKAPASDWPFYSRDLAGTRFSPLAQINGGNVGRLAQAWSVRLAPEGIAGAASPTEVFQEVTPIVVNGVMYLPAGNRILALEPETGKEIWRYELKAGQASFRGVAYWPGDRNNPPRILFTSLKKMLALNANTGKPDPGFGREGEIDMTVAFAGVPTIYKDVILVGANAFGPGERHIDPQGELPEWPDKTRGDSRAYDARTGRKLWEFHTTPQPGETGHDSWEGDSWKDRGGNNVWSVAMAVDEQRGIVYMPVGGPAANYWGGDRKGNNLFANSLVAVDAATGKLKWYFQTIHHELWDYDLPPEPVLLDIVKDGKKIPAVAQTGKAGYMFILDRVTGKPVFGVEERPVPRGSVPGEWYSPTQPFPLKPPPLARISIKPEDLVAAEDTTPEHAQACRELWEKNKFYNAGPYTPWPLQGEGVPPLIQFPGFTGGINWGGTAADPKSGYIFLHTKDSAATGWVRQNPKYTPGADRNELPYDRAGGPPFSVAIKDNEGRIIGNWPCQKPPWSRLVAVNANTGDIAWQVPLGVNETLPEGKRNAGAAGSGGPIATAGGLVFIGATTDLRFRAFDSRSGKELWSAKLDYNVTAVPITYQGKNGKQYLAVVAASGGPRRGNGQSLVAFALP